MNATMSHAEISESLGLLTTAQLRDFRKIDMEKMKANMERHADERHAAHPGSPLNERLLAKFSTSFANFKVAVEYGAEKDDRIENLEAEIAALKAELESRNRIESTMNDSITVLRNTVATQNARTSRYPSVEDRAEWAQETGRNIGTGSFTRSLGMKLASHTRHTKQPA